MAQNIGKKRGKSSIKTRLEQERKAGRKDPKGKKNFQKAVAIASLAIPGGVAVKAGAKAAKAVKAVKKKAVKKVAKKTREFNKNLAESNKLVKAEKSGYPLKNIKASAKDKSVRSLTKNMKEFKKNYGADNLKRAISGVDKKIVDAKKRKKLIKKKIVKKKIVLRERARQKAKQKTDNLEKVFTKKSRENMKPSGSTRKRRMEEGGLVKSHRGDGIAKRGKTRGRMV